MTVYFGLLLSMVNAGDLAANQPVRPISIAAIQPVSLKLEGEKSETANKPAATATTKNQNVKQASAKSADTKQTDKKKANIKQTAAKQEPKSTQKKDAKKGSKPKELKPLKRRVLVFKADWCGACQQLSAAFPTLRKVRWRIGTKNTDHFQLIDVDRQPGLMNRYGVTSLPTVILLDGDKEIQRRGVLNAIDLAELYYGRLR